jgi:hypothetical protein
MAIKVGDRRICASCGTQIIVIREGTEDFAVTCCGAVLEARVACGTTATTAEHDR